MGILLEVCVIRRELRIINLCDTEGQLSSITVLQLKEKIIEQFGYQWQPSDLCLICDGRELEEPALLSQCGIRHMSTILVVQRVGLPGGGPLPADMRGAQQFINSSTDMGIQLEVRGITGEKKTIDLCVGELLTGITVLQLKERTIEEFGYQWQPSDLHLFCDGRELEEPDRLSQYGITHMSTIHVVKLLLGGGGRPPPVTGDGGMGDKDGKN